MLFFMIGGVCGGEGGLLKVTLAEQGQEMKFVVKSLIPGPLCGLKANFIMRSYSKNKIFMEKWSSCMILPKYFTECPISILHLISENTAPIEY